MKIDLPGLNQRDSHHVMVSAVTPRPIAWVSTVGRDGVNNLAPFSSFGIVSLKPAMLGFLVAPTRDGKKKDTIVNIEYTKEYVINVVTEVLAQQMNVTAINYPANVDEFIEAGLTAVKADLVNAPMLSESPINLECRLTRILEFGEAPRINYYIIGEVLRAHIKDEVCIFGEILGSKLKAIGRLGGGEDMYCRTTDMFELVRPD